MTGGTGALNDTTTDVFKWSLADQGSTGTPAADVIKDFSLAPITAGGVGGDVLDLKDLLTNEHSSTAGNLDNFLHITDDGHGHAVISVDPTGTGAAPTQTITLENVSFTELQTWAGGTTDHDIIAKLVATGHLKTDV